MRHYATERKINRLIKGLKEAKKARTLWSQSLIRQYEKETGVHPVTDIQQDIDNLKELRDELAYEAWENEVSGRLYE